jgi:hypothetical protein
MVTLELNKVDEVLALPPAVLWVERLPLAKHLGRLLRDRHGLVESGHLLCGFLVISHHVEPALVVRTPLRFVNLLASNKVPTMWYWGYPRN